MPIKQLALEDVTATLQVPIPGVPGAYGEIELSGDGTATIALGAEIPVPFLDDMVNGEIQVEINKEGEIAYGVEINLVGLQLETMVRGCDIVTTLSYGALSTEAVYKIPDCEQPPPPEPLPLPPPGGEDDWGESRELTPLPPPNIPDDTRIMALIYTSDFKHEITKNYHSFWTRSDGTSGSYSEHEENAATSARSLTKWKPEEGTELMSHSINSAHIFTNSYGRNENSSSNSSRVDGWINGKSTQPYDLLSFTLPGSPESEFFRIPRYWPYRRSFAGNSFGVATPPSWAGNSTLDASWVFVGTVAQLKNAMQAFPYHYSNVTTKRRVGYTNTETIYWDGLGISSSGSGVSRYRIIGQTIQPYSYDYRIPGKTYEWLNTSHTSSTTEEREAITRTMVIIEVSKDKKPPLQGEPPMKDCCADIRAELRRLRKEFKKVSDAFNPEGFTESILPPKYNEKGERIKPGDDAITLPDVLKELGESGSSGTYDPEIAKIENQNVPVSWKESEPPIEQKLPKEKVGDEWVFREMFTLLHEIRYALDPHDIRETEIPSRFIYPGISEGYEKIRNYPELFKNIFLMLDKVGFQPFQVQVDDVNPAVAGNQAETHQFHSMGAALESTIKYLIDIEGDQDAHTSFLVRLAYEVILLHQISAATQQTVSNIQDFLGYELRKKKESIPMAFNPLADNPANRGKIDENTEESIEKLLPNLLKNGTAETTVEEYVGRKDLIDFLFEILNAARQKPKGNRLG